MYEKLSHRAEAVVKAAYSSAHEYEQEYVGTEHLLLAIARDHQGTGSKILHKLGASTAKIKEQVDQLIKQSLEETWVFGRLPGTPHFRNVIASAIEAAQQLESKEVCTEHLLLALMKESGSVAHNALKNLDVKIDDVRREVADFGSKN